MPTMSEQREQIATAVSVLVDGYQVVGQPTPPGVVSPLISWPVWDSSEPQNRCAAETTWRVIVALPTADSQTWDAATDVIVEAVTTALYSLGRVSRVEPVTWMGQDTTGYPCLSFTLII